MANNDYDEREMKLAVKPGYHMIDLELTEPWASLGLFQPDVSQALIL